MIFNSFFPTMIEIALMFVRKFKKRRDRKNTEGGTKQTSIQGYIDLFSGPKFDVHFRYANILNIVYVTMMYGAALPILFPIALFSIGLLYLQENYMLYYAYKKPPTYDEQLNKKVVKALKFSPLFLTGFSFWQLSN